MRILIYGINFYPELTGIGKYTAEFASFLVSQGVEVRVITAPPYYPEWRVHAGYSSWCYQKQNWKGIQVIRCPLWVPIKRGGLRRILHLLSFAISSFPAALSQLFWKPNLVFAVAPALTSAPFAWLLGRLVGARTWLHLQDLEVDAALGLGIVKKGLLARLIFALERWILQRFDHISTISNAMAQRVQAKDIPPDKISLFPNWVDCDQIYPLPSSHIRKELGISEQACVVLYAGNMGEKQGLEVLLQAAYHLAEHAEIQFVFCGDGAQREVLQAQAQAQAVSNVKFLPLQPLEQLNELLNLADIHVLPQRQRRCRGGHAIQIGRDVSQWQSRDCHCRRGYRTGCFGKTGGCPGSAGGSSRSGRGNWQIVERSSHTGIIRRKRQAICLNKFVGSVYFE